MGPALAKVGGNCKRQKVLARQAAQQAHLARGRALAREPVGAEGAAGNDESVEVVDIGAADELVDAVKATVASTGLQSCYIRPIAFRGYGEMGVSPLATSVSASTPGPV